MRAAMRWSSVLVLTLLVMLVAAGVAEARRSDSDVTFVNRTSWDIYEIYLSAVDESDWGPDQLEEGILETGGTFLLYGIPCDDYDVLLIDEDGDECVVEDVDLCGDSEEWVIRDKDLLECQFG